MARDSTVARLRRRARRHGVEPAEELARGLARFYELLFRWNQTVNLTALADGEEAIDRLLVEPLVASRWLPEEGLLVDVGSGGGSPGVPLALTRPRLRLVLVEAKVRKSAFLREVLRELDLERGAVVTARVEDLAGHQAWQGCANVVSVRAVRLDARVMGRLRQLLQPGGELWWFTGPGAGVPGLAGEWSLAGEHALLPPLGSRLLRVRPVAAAVVAP